MAFVRPLLGKWLEELEDRRWSRASDLHALGEVEKANKIMFLGLPPKTAREYYFLSEARAASKPEKLRRWYTWSRFHFLVFSHRINAWLDRPFP